MTTPLRADRRARVLTVLELALEEADAADVLDDPEAIARNLASALVMLGLSPVEPGLGVDLIDLIESEQRRRELDRLGTDALDPDVTYSVPRTRALEFELEALGGNVLDAVDRLAFRLPA